MLLDQNLKVLKNDHKQTTERTMLKGGIAAKKPLRSPIGQRGETSSRR